MKAIAVIAAIALALLAAINVGFSPSPPDLIIEKIRRDVAEHLQVGAHENTIVPFFNKQGWKYASGSISGSFEYNAEIHLHKTFLGEDRFLLVRIDAKDGFIRRVHVSEFSRFL